MHMIISALDSSLDNGKYKSFQLRKGFVLTDSGTDICSIQSSLDLWRPQKASVSARGIKMV